LEDDHPVLDHSSLHSHDAFVADGPFRTIGGGPASQKPFPYYSASAPFAAITYHAET
jgi:hypothetical protein